MASILIEQQGGYNQEPNQPIYGNLLITASRTGASALQAGYKFRVRVIANGVTIAEVQQPANPDGKLYFDPAAYLKAYVTDNEIDSNATQGNIIKDRLQSWGVVYYVMISGVIDNVEVDPTVSTRQNIGYNGVTGFAQPLFIDEQMSWFKNDQLPTNCIDCLTTSTNQGLLSFQPNWITKAQDPTITWAVYNSSYEFPQVDLPRLQGAIVPMYVQQWSSSQSNAYGDRTSPFTVYGIFAFRTQYFNGNQLIATTWATSTTTGIGASSNSWGPLTTCGQPTAIVSNTSITINPAYSVLSMGYSYNAAPNEINATHAWVTAHAFSNPQNCGRPYTGPLNCASQTSIAEYAGIVPIAAYRVNYKDTCATFDDQSSTKEKPGQLIFLNSVGGWDVINLKNVKVNYNTKKSTWTSQNQPTLFTNNPNQQASGWAAKSNHVYESDSNITFQCATDYLNDYSETLIRQAFNSPSAYLNTGMPYDNIYPGASGDEYALQKIKGIITTPNVTPKRRATDKLYQYNFEFLADAKYKTQRS